MKKINHFKTAAKTTAPADTSRKKTKTAKSVSLPKTGQMTVYYPGENRTPPKVVKFTGRVPTLDEIEAEVGGHVEQIHGFRTMWRSSNVHDERKVPAVTYGHCMGRVIGMELNHDASEIWFDQDAYNDWTAKFIQAQGNTPPDTRSSARSSC